MIRTWTHREQRVRVNNSISRSRKVRSGVPQGSVLGPVLFLIYIADLQMTDPKSFCKLLKFVDDSKVMARINSDEDVAQLQEDLAAVFRWAGDNHMRWNDLKFQVLRLGTNHQIIEDTTLFSPDFGEVVEAKDTIKDLGILVDRQLSYVEQLYKAVNKTKQKAGWVLRTFSTRDIPLLRTLWKSLIQCHLDYGNILWAPYSGHGEAWKWKLLEGTLREFTRKGKGLTGLNYWSRLRAFKVSSIQRRIERYRLIYTWKSLNDLAPSLGINWVNNGTSRSGRTLEVRKVKGLSSSLQTQRRRTIQHEGVRLLNVIPSPIQNFSGKAETFKYLLDNFLECVPDQPYTDSLVPEARDYNDKPSNSIYDWCKSGRIQWTPPIELERVEDYYIVKPIVCNLY